MLRVGLTGGIACGKSNVLRRLQAHGIATLDLDSVAHRLMAPGGAAHSEVVSRFGHDILDASGAIDRKALGNLVFAEPEARARLNAIVHPMVRAEEARLAADHAKEGSPLLVTDAALLVESGLHLRFDRLVVVHCSRERQLERIRDRDGLDAGQAAARVEAQMPSAEKVRYGHYTVDTEGSLEDTRRGADALAAELKRVASEPPQRPDRLVERGTACLGAAQVIGLGPVEPTFLIHDIVAAGGLEMERIASAIGLSGREPWFRKGARAGQGDDMTAVVVVVVLWVLARRGVDLDLVASAVASIAGLASAGPTVVAGACLFGVALAEMALPASPPPGPERLGDWLSLARRWGRASPGPQVTETVATGLTTGWGATGNPGSVLLAMAEPQVTVCGDISRAVERLVVVARVGR